MSNTARSEPASKHLLAALARPDGLILAADAAAVGLHEALRTEFTHRRVTRLRRGVYLPTPHWECLSTDDRYLFRIRAFAAVSVNPPVFSHHSAAAIWGFPRPSSWPLDVHIISPSASGGRSKPGVVRHSASAPRFSPTDAMTRGGLLVTPPADTAVAMARILPFPEAVAMMDKAIHLPRMMVVGGTPESALATRGELRAALDILARAGRRAGKDAALRAGDFASTRSDSGGESISRAHMFLLGFAAPELQVRFDDAEGFIAFVDFFWRGINKVGEFDGLGKYLKGHYTRGRTTAEVVMDEKRREDRIRACGPSVSRWDWPIARDLVAFGAFLTNIGVPRTR
ncbi:hypothetical protein E3T39_09625 [Cryobacterium suzukii]|uniref:Transcriptional regulator, AbiEi antitoxin, Type IV TA system n=1 Tax=Cryobacterium suzukii TaxID=1259198 RepID=A0A4R9AFI4_9MICO|nr:hypothetical protein [Cryobacterium suzukii]TFD59930.1 hypothetical protein E3T39_09625 [Cryobacterium suzukii]